MEDTVGSEQNYREVKRMVRVGFNESLPSVSNQTEDLSRQVLMTERVDLISARCKLEASLSFLLSLLHLSLSLSFILSLLILSSLLLL